MPTSYAVCDVKNMNAYIGTESENIAIGSEVDGKDDGINFVANNSDFQPTEPEKSLFENSVKEHFDCNGTSLTPEFADPPPSRNRMRKNISQVEVHAAIFQAPPKFRASHDTLDVDLSDDSYYSDDGGSDATSSYVGVTSYRSDGIPKMNWDKEFVWGNKSNLHQRTINPNDRSTHIQFQSACLKLSIFSLTSSDESTTAAGKVT